MFSLRIIVLFMQNQFQLCRMEEADHKFLTLHQQVCERHLNITFTTPSGLTDTANSHSSGS